MLAPPPAMWASSAALGPDWTGSCCLLRDAVAITICLLLCVQTSASEEASKELELRQFLKAASLSAAEVNLAEDTAYPCFILSKDRRSVTHGAIWKDVPQTTKRFSCLPCVLASNSFRSGKWYWDVEVGSWGSWAIGVAKVSVERTGEFLLFPDMGVWALQCMEGQWEALTIPRTRLCMEEKPRKIRVQVDCERQSVSFYEAEDLAHIFTFPCCSWELVSPFFALWTMGTELRILPPGCLGREESSHVSCDPDVDDESVPLSFGQLQGRLRT